MHNAQCTTALRRRDGSARDGRYVRLLRERHGIVCGWPELRAIR